jgi:hypothetical protein
METGDDSEMNPRGFLGIATLDARKNPVRSAILGWKYH